MSDQHLHLAIIPDGNRRWAKTKGLLPWNGHERAIENFRAILDWCAKSGRIGTLTIWCFSTENWKRSPEEVSELMRIYESYLHDQRPKFQEEQTRLVHSGRTDRIPKSLRDLLLQVAEETRNNTKFTMHLALDYGGIDEIVRASQRLLESRPLDLPVSRTVTEQEFRSYLDHPELTDIDIVLRTSGEQRTSNFFLWQTAYSEWIFTKKLFPELTVADLEATLQEFDARKRRYGS